MKLQLLVAVGLGSVTLAGIAAGAPLAVTAGTMMLAATALRNTTIQPETCLTLDQKGPYCHYNNKCDFPISTTSGRGVNIIPSKGRASCLTDENGPIPPNREDVTLKANPEAVDCIVVHRTKDSTKVRNHCNKALVFTVENQCKDIKHTKLIPKREKVDVPIKFSCFADKDIQVDFDTQKTEN